MGKIYEEWVIFIVHGMDDFLKFFNYLFFVFFYLIFSIFNLFTSTPEYRISRGEELVNIVLVNSANVIERKYKIRACGSGVSMPEGPIRWLTICFDTEKTATKEELRKLLINSAQIVVDFITSNEEIQPFLKVRPFTMENVQIIIYNHNEKGYNVYDPGISTAQISDLMLTYRTTDAADTFKFKNKYIETYEEALEKIKQKDVSEK